MLHTDARELTPTTDTQVPHHSRLGQRRSLTDSRPSLTSSRQAASDIDTVNGLWKGLGYYSRAARLLSGAQKAVEEFGGRLPDNAQDMESKIPGIGRYSAGAICSIAYSQCVPVVSAARRCRSHCANICCINFLHLRPSQF